MKMSKNSEKPPFGALAIIPRPPPRGQKNSPLKSFHRFTIYLVPPSKMAQKGGFWGFLAPPPYPPQDPKIEGFLQNFAKFLFLFSIRSLRSRAFSVLIVSVNINLQGTLHVPFIKLILILFILKQIYETRKLINTFLQPCYKIFQRGRKILKNPCSERQQ